MNSLSSQNPLNLEYISEFYTRTNHRNVITPREGCKLVVRSSKGASQEDYLVDAVEVVSLWPLLLLPFTRAPKSFLVPVSDYEILETKETRMIIKNASAEQAIKIGGGRDNRPREQEQPRDATLADSRPAPERQQQGQGKRDRRGRRRRGRDRHQEQNPDQQQHQPHDGQAQAHEGHAQSRESIMGSIAMRMPSRSITTRNKSIITENMNIAINSMNIVLKEKRLLQQLNKGEEVKAPSFISKLFLPLPLSLLKTLSAAMNLLKVKLRIKTSRLLLKKISKTTTKNNLFKNCKSGIAPLLQFLFSHFSTII